MQNSKVGDVRYRDANGDGVINDSDRTLMGKPDPDYTFGITNTFKYKKLRLIFPDYRTDRRPDLQRPGTCHGPSGYGSQR